VLYRIVPATIAFQVGERWIALAISCDTLGERWIKRDSVRACPGGGTSSAVQIALFSSTFSTAYYEPDNEISMAFELNTGNDARCDAP